MFRNGPGISSLSGAIRVLGLPEGTSVETLTFDDITNAYLERSAELMGSNNRDHTTLSAALQFAENAIRDRSMQRGTERTYVTAYPASSEVATKKAHFSFDELSAILDTCGLTGNDFYISSSSYFANSIDVVFRDTDEPRRFFDVFNKIRTLTNNSQAVRITSDLGKSIIVVPIDLIDVMKSNLHLQSLDNASHSVGLDPLIKNSSFYPKNREP